jgi:GTP cyclohydrolase I
MSNTPHPMNSQNLLFSLRTLIAEAGENPDREVLRDTPQRFLKTWKEILSGYRENPHEVLENSIFPDTVEDMVILRNIEFYSLCEHHLLPFLGKCHVAYIPDGKIVGLSKIVRMIEIFSRRLQVQERLTREIASSIEQHLEPKGVAVVMEATHLCMVMRGIKKEGALAITSSMLGAFRSSEATRAEFLSLIRSSA